MKKLNLLTTLILVMTALTGADKAFATASVEQTINLSVQPAVAIEKTTSKESGNVSAKTGVHEGLNASFKIQTNGTDDNYDFIIGSFITTATGNVSAFGENDTLLFANTTIPPTSSAVENAKVAGTNNPNVIAYPIVMDITSPMVINYDPEKETNEGKGCYIVKINTGRDGVLTQTIEKNPVKNTYSMADEAGTYKSTVYFTAVSR